jgi:hypothetical protein
MAIALIPSIDLCVIAMARVLCAENDIGWSRLAARSSFLRFLQGTNRGSLPDQTIVASECALPCEEDFGKNHTKKTSSKQYNVFDEEIGSSKPLWGVARLRLEQRQLEPFCRTSCARDAHGESCT